MPPLYASILSAIDNEELPVEGTISDQFQKVEYYKRVPVWNMLNVCLRT